MRRWFESAQYAAKPYRERLELHGIRGSMSRKGNPYDNTKAESFIKTLKHEEVLMAGYRDLADVQQRLFRFVDEVYNERRLHSALGYLPPTSSNKCTAAKRSIAEHLTVHLQGAANITPGTRIAPVFGSCHTQSLMRVNRSGSIVMLYAC